MYDISQRVDQYFDDHDEPPAYRYLFAGHMSSLLENALTRYERRLGRLLTADEGQVLMHLLNEVNPQNSLPRFVRCEDCGRWLDRGKLTERNLLDGAYCDDCNIPF